LSRTTHHMAVRVRARATFVDGFLIEREDQRYAARPSLRPDPQHLTISLMGVTDPTDLHWLWAHLTPHPALSALQELPGDHTPARQVPHTFILCPETSGATTPFSPFGELVRAGGGQHFELVGGHNIMVTKPRELAELMLEIAVQP
jgi:hypothetical protein